MNEGLPAYIPVAFILTTILTVGIFIYAISRAGFQTLPGKLLTVFVFVWLLVNAVLAYNGFFRNFTAPPPRVFAVGVLPFVVLTFAYLVLFRNFLSNMPLTVLTLIHVIRVPVELILLALFQHGQVPIEMTFEGRNFDILSGITSPVIYFLAFRNGRVNRPLLIVWNFAALALLINIVTVAVLAFPTPFQRFGLAQPNIGVTYFPFIWLPAVIVPIVFFSHVASLYQLLSSRDDTIST